MGSFYREALAAGGRDNCTPRLHPGVPPHVLQRIWGSSGLLHEVLEVARNLVL